MGERANLTAEPSRPRLRAVRDVPADTAELGGLSTFTIEDFLAMPVTQQGAPVVVAGKQHLDRRVRWLHVIELVDTQGLLQGGELILATGIAFPQAPEEIAQYVDALADQGIAGLAIELGRRFATVPPAMVRACNRRHVPLIAFHREVPFVKMTEAAHSIILMGQRRLLQVTAAAHERFTELTSAEAPMEDLVTAAAELAGGQVVFANLMHQVLALHEPDGETEQLLNRWNRKAFTLTKAFGTQVDKADHTVVTPVEVRGRQRGRLVLFSTGPPDRAQVTVIERAAVALGMLLLLQDDDVVVANAHRTVLESIISGRSGGVEAMHARAAALGRPTRGRYYLPVVVVSAGRDLRWVVNRALDETRLDGLAAQVGPDRWGALLLLKTEQFEQAVSAFAACVLELCRGVGIDRPVVARGGLVSALADVRHSVAEAVDVALASRVAGSPRNRKDVYAIEDVKLRGLLYTLRNDSRLQAFVERMLGPLLHRDTLDGGGDWVRTLGVYLRFQGNKSLTAQELGVSRPTLYERLGRIQRLLRVDLDDPEWSTSLYAAIMVVEATAADSPALPQKRRESL
ncbi:PucR family transcriptional regulator [Phytohabitans houttuyneae]|uniref:CdaR family transcriptional regulator n=1 Tax=Phytohabitans houttuyneae TaxID=1076126 RepID=A0A6V8KKY5_9ACTN|nr:PucR family transcriptional regulator [Phytohabitans houttuyneae]GFJ82417.1 CdaR family transcriptional regulator [Phytohabitans houttuyneae]